MRYKSPVLLKVYQKLVIVNCFYDRGAQHKEPQNNEKEF
jgi:hypothetical protein